MRKSDLLNAGEILGSMSLSLLYFFLIWTLVSDFAMSTEDIATLVISNGIAMPVAVWLWKLRKDKKEEETKIQKYEIYYSYFISFLLGVLLLVIVRTPLPTFLMIFGPVLWATYRWWKRRK